MDTSSFFFISYVNVCIGLIIGYFKILIYVTGM